MKFFSLLIILIIPLRLLEANCFLDYFCSTGWTLEVRGAVYCPTSSRVRKIYSDYWLDYQIETSKRIRNILEVWGEISWANKHGHAQPFSYGFKDRTRLSIVPISLGIKVIYPIFSCMEVYCGAGVAYSFLQIKNTCKEHYSYWGLHRSPFRHFIHKNGVGAIFKAGVQYTLCDSTFIDVFAEYLSQRFHFSHHEDRSGRSVFHDHLDCSGFKFGAGLGVYF